MTPSAYQTKVYDHFKHMAGHSAVVSVAGSGKTVTALKSIEYLPYGTSTLLGAFNVSIRDEFKEKGLKAGLKNVTYTNFNGFGWGLCARNMKKMPELDKEKTANIFEFVVYKPDRDDQQDMQKFLLWRPPIVKLVELIRALNIHTISDAAAQLNDIIDHYNIDTPGDKNFEQCVLDTYTACINHLEHFDFTDQKFMPIHLGFPVPAFDQVIVDEFQDVCEVEYALMSAAARGGQFCAIGDPDQTIYGFKGCNLDRFPDYIRDMGATELPLSICYRCPIEVVKAAQQIVPRIEWAPGAKQGRVETIGVAKFLLNVKDKDFVLCRTTDELVATQIELTRLGRKSKVRGRDFCTGLEWLINKISGRNMTMAIDKFTAELIKYQIERSEQLTIIRREGEIMALEDKCKTVRALCDEAKTVADIFKRMAAVFSDVPHDGIDLMTIHKSKGLQAANVWILRPDLLPHPRSAKRAWMLKEEMRLKYVAITRATDSLFWVEGRM